LLLLFFFKKNIPLLLYISYDRDEFLLSWFHAFCSFPRFPFIYSFHVIAFPPITVTALSRSSSSIHYHHSCIMYIYMQYIQNIQKHYSTCFPYEAFFHIEGTIQIYSFSFASDLGGSLGLRLVGTECHRSNRHSVGHYSLLYGIYSGGMAQGPPWLRTGSDHQNEPPPTTMRRIELNRSVSR
jgi:hypothetical protein